MIINWILIWLTSLFVVPGSENIPVFKGGHRALENFISGHIVYPGYSKQNWIQGTVQVSFNLTHKGKVFGQKIHKGFGIDLDDEALRIIRLTSGKWVVPAGFDTTSTMTIPITFSLQDYNCAGRSQSDIRDAINAYRAQEELAGAITNFYEKKETGNYSPGDEQKIEKLKEQLGYNDEFIADLISQAKRKIKQGDKEGACEDLKFIKKIGSNQADELIKENCK